MNNNASKVEKQINNKLQTSFALFAFMSDSELSEYEKQVNSDNSQSAAIKVDSLKDDVIRVLSSKLYDKHVPKISQHDVDALTDDLQTLTEVLEERGYKLNNVEMNDGNSITYHISELNNL